MPTIGITVYSYRLKINRIWHEGTSPTLPTGAVELIQISKSVKPEDDVCAILKKIDQQIDEVLARKWANVLTLAFLFKTNARDRRR